MALPFLDAFRHFKCTTDSKDTKRKKGRDKNTKTLSESLLELLIKAKKFPFTGRNFLSQEDISFHSKKFPVTGRNFLSQEEISCHRKKFPVTGRNFRSQEEISCHRKTFSKLEKRKWVKIFKMQLIGQDTTVLRFRAHYIKS